MNTYAARMPGEPAIAFCVSIDHARHVAAQFTRAGWRAVSVDGTMSDRERDAAIHGLASGHYQVLTSCQLVSEGTNIPVVAGAILLRPTKSVLLHVQQVGRVLRVYPGKTRSCIIDIADNVKLHGLPGADRAWTLADGLAPATHRTIRCPNCHRRFEPANMCPTPGCGHRFLARDVQQVPLTIANLSPQAFQRMTTAQLEHIAKSEADLRRIQREKQLAPGWLFYAKQRLAQRNMQGRYR